MDRIQKPILILLLFPEERKRVFDGLNAGKTDLVELKLILNFLNHSNYK
jgi:hypothetical protein